MQCPGPRRRAAGTALSGRAKGLGWRYAPAPSARGTGDPTGPGPRGQPPTTYCIEEGISLGIDDQQCHLGATGPDEQHDLLVVQLLHALAIYCQQPVAIPHACLLSRQPHIHLPQELPWRVGENRERQPKGTHAPVSPWREVGERETEA